MLKKRRELTDNELESCEMFEQWNTNWRPAVYPRAQADGNHLF